MKITRAKVLKIYKAVDPKTHKGVQGHALIIGGSYGKMGAPCLSAKAALKTGCGLVTAYIPECGYQILQTAIPEVMAITDSYHKKIAKIKYDILPDAIGIGPGMGQGKTVQKALHKFLQHVSVPLVIDADAINMIAKNPDWLSLLPENTLLTPHPKELERLIGSSTSEKEILEKTIALSEKYNLIIVMKGAPTKIVFGKTIYENTTGNAALATAGSGDVLTGIITSLLAQGYEPIIAAMLGVYLHGLTADIALPQTGIQSFIASDIIEYIGKAYLKLEKPSAKS